MTFRQVAEDLHFYGLPANRDTVKLHKQFSSTSCPHRSVALHGDNTKVQDYFIARVKHYMSLGKTVAEMLKKDGQTVVSKPTATPVVSKPAAKKYNLGTRTLRLTNPQMNGNDVKSVQQALASIYYYPNKGAKNNGVDGWYGPKSVDAVKRFQSVYGLQVDGKVGPATRKKIDSLVNK